MSATNASDPSSYFLENVNGILGISIDDRTIKKGDLFVALIGDKFNGHDFIENAIRKGAYGIIVSDMKLANKYNGQTKFERTIPVELNNKFTFKMDGQILR